jgi:hypothetical protein
MQNYGLEELQLFAENGDVVLSVAGEHGTLCIPMPVKTAHWMVNAIMDTVDEALDERERELKRRRLDLER